MEPASFVLIKLERSGECFAFAAQTVDLDSCEARRGPTGEESETVLDTALGLPTMSPLREREILDMTLSAYSHNADRDEIGSSRLRDAIAIKICSAGAAAALAHECQVLHHTSTWTVMPARKPRERDVLIRQGDPRPGISEVWRKTKVTDTQTSLKP